MKGFWFVLGDHCLTIMAHEVNSSLPVLVDMAAVDDDLIGLVREDKYPSLGVVTDLGVDDLHVRILADHSHRLEGRVADHF